MAQEKDIARSLPDPPPPNPARREAAIAAALRRFDGESGSESLRPAARPTPWWTQINRQHSALWVSAALVAIVAVPTVWQSVSQYAPPPASKTMTVPANPSSQPRQEPAEAKASPSAPAIKVPPIAAMPATPPPAINPPTTENRAMAAPPLIAQPSADMAAAPAIAPPLSAPPPPPPPAPMAARAAAPAMAMQKAEAARDSEGLNDIFVTSQRRTRARPLGRGDWNACTVSDPAQSLSKCKRQINVDAKHDASRASAQLGDGLSLAWQGDYRGALAAFDRAIALSPRLALAHLNRGLAYQRMGDTDRALASFDSAIRYAPYAARGYYARGVLLRENGDERRANSDEKRAIDLDPSYEATLP